MNKDTRLGDSMPPRKDVKWGSMTPSTQHTSGEWESMTASECRTSEKWIEQHPSKGHMSDKWVEQHAGDSSFSDQWATMKQDKRMDPYQMQPGRGDDTTTPFKAMAKEKADGGRVGRATQHNEFGSTREI